MSGRNAGVRAFAAGVLTACAALSLPAGLEPVSPVGGQTVPLVPAEQKRVMAPPTLAARLELVKSDKTLKDEGLLWQRALPLVLKVGATDGEKGPWKVEIGRREDLSDAQVWYVSQAKFDKATGREIGNAVTGRVAAIEVPRANLELATRYYWRVSCRGRCAWDCHWRHGCKASRKLSVSPVSTFVTEDFAPRWIAVEGRVGNIRDLGGRRGLGGRRVRQGLVYRGQGLNDNSVTTEAMGRNRLMVEDVAYLTGALGIRTDLDLRTVRETADMAVSPLGANVKLIIRSSPYYKSVFEDWGKAAMAENFRVFCDRANYPVYFHCIGGADRTGSLAYVLHAVLGVDRHENETDWESTFYPGIPDGDPRNTWCRESHFNDGFGRYGDADTPWNDRVVLYLKDCGVTDAEIEAFRRIMLADGEGE